VSPPAATETETTLLAAGPDPRGLFARLAAQPEIAGLSLHSLGTRRLEDRYLDTAEGALRERRIALRVRGTGGDPPRRLVTVKGPARVHQDGRMERRELELPWSGESVELAVSALREMGAELPRPDPAPPADDPERVLRSLGLRGAQERRTTRGVVELRAAAEGEELLILAEMDLDAVTFQLSSREVRHFEIEIEARESGGGDAVSAVSRALLADHGAELVLWPFSKTATGEGLARLAEEGALAALLDEEGRPTAAAYRELRRLLRT
jgi:inorganic triphosphatase YgiF